jgi:hypothetical protein
MEFDIDKIKAIQDPIERTRALNEYQEWMEAQRKADKKNKRSEDNKVYRETHKENIKKWKEKHKEELRLHRLKYKEANKDKVKISWLRMNIKRKEFLIQRKITELNMLKNLLADMIKKVNGGDTNAKDLPERPGDQVCQEAGRTETDFADAGKLLQDPMEQQDEKEGDSKGTEDLNPDSQKTG